MADNRPSTPIEAVRPDVREDLTKNFGAGIDQ